MFVLAFFLAWFALLIFALLDIDRSPPEHVRTMGWALWVVVVVVVPIVGSLAWIVAGRPNQARGDRAPGQGRDQLGAAKPVVGQPAPPAVAAHDTLQATLDLIDDEFEDAVRRRRGRARGESPEG